MSRATMIAQVKGAIGAWRGSQAERQSAVADRLAHPPRHPRPGFARLDAREREARLVQCLESQGGTVLTVGSRADIPNAVETLVASMAPMPRFPMPRFVVGDDERLTALPWPQALVPARWTPDQTLGDGTVALTHAWGAAAETGTLIMVSGPASPASLAFLPEVHIVALARGSIAASFEEAFAELGADIGSSRFPRAVNLISSPSRTSDIGGRSVRGAHGPRSLAVVLYGSNEFV
jgi:L-lactate dehydrogenase complex protein LldG